MDSKPCAWCDSDDIRLISMESSDYNMHHDCLDEFKATLISMVRREKMIQVANKLLEKRKNEPKRSNP